MSADDANLARSPKRNGLSPRREHHLSDALGDGSMRVEHAVHGLSRVDSVPPLFSPVGSQFLGPSMAEQNQDNEERWSLARGMHTLANVPAPDDEEDSDEDPMKNITYRPLVNYPPVNRDEEEEVPSDDGEMIDIGDALQQPAPSVQETPPKALADTSPPIPAAPMRPPSAHAKRKSPVPPKLEQAFEQVAKFPELSVALKHSQVPCNKAGIMDVLVSAKPPLCNPSENKVVLVVLNLDISLSMRGDKIQMLKQVVRDLFADGLCGITLYIRVLCFGMQIEDWKMGEHEMELLCEELRPDFLRIADSLYAKHCWTDIGQPVLAGIDICKRFMAQGVSQHGDTIPSKAYVVTLTDGSANAGITEGDKLAIAVRQSGAAALGISLCFIGLGAIDAEFMRETIEGGNLGVLVLAPNAEHIGNAFEDVFGGVISKAAMTSQASFSFRVIDPSRSEAKRDYFLGMLSKPRSHCVTVRIPCCAKPCVRPFVTVQMLGSRGEPIGKPVHTEIEYKGAEYGPANSLVCGFERAVKIEEKRNEILASATSMEAASQALDQLALRTQTEMNSDEDEDGFVHAAFRSIQAASKESKDTKYRSLCSAGPALLGARIESLERNI